MNENTDKNNKLKEDNLEMSSKFKYILEQYELREQQMDKINKQMDLVTQLNDAKLAKIQVELQAEREKFSKETSIYEDTIKILKHQLGESRTAERLLKEQVDLYSGKYGEFQESLKKSHDVFEGYKTDMTKMSKKNIKMEKEMYLWKAKFEKSNALLLDLVSEKQVKDEHITKTAKQMYHLQKLCRQLQFERTAFLTSLKENNIEIPVIPEAPKETKIELPPEPVVEAPPKVDDTKLDLMTKNCDQLKKNLAQLQGQLANLQTAESEEAAKPAAVPATSKKEKSKNKKGKKDKSKAASNVAAEPELNGKSNGIEITENSAKDPELQKNLSKDPEQKENLTKDPEQANSSKELEQKENSTNKPVQQESPTKVPEQQQNLVKDSTNEVPSNSEEVKPEEILEKSPTPANQSPVKISNNKAVEETSSSVPQQSNDQVTT